MCDYKSYIPVKYLCDKDQKLTFKAYGVAGKAVKKVVVQGKEATCATDATSVGAAHVVAFTAGTGLVADPTTGTIDPAADETACGYAAVCSNKYAHMGPDTQRATK